MAFDILDNRSDPAVQRLVDLAKSARGAKSMIVEDEEPLAQALAAGVEVVEVYGPTSSGVPEEIARLSAERGVPVRLLDQALAAQVFRTDKVPKVFGVAKVPAPAAFRDLRDVPGDVVVLDGVRIVGNIGAIVRSAFALGAAGVVLLDSGLTTVAERRLLRASRGYVFSLPVVLATAEQLDGFLGETKLRLIALDAGGSMSLAQLGDLDERVALLLGGEKTGSSQALAARAQDVVSIPMNSRAESLNVSVAAGIALQARSARSLGASA